MLYEKIFYIIISSFISFYIQSSIRRMQRWTW